MLHIVELVGPRVSLFGDSESRGRSLIRRPTSIPTDTTPIRNPQNSHTSQRGPFNL